MKKRKVEFPERLGGNKMFNSFYEVEGSRQLSTRMCSMLVQGSMLYSQKRENFSFFFSLHGCHVHAPKYAYGLDHREGLLCHCCQRPHFDC